uniref:PAS domain-containing protein n=1 Tax=Knipowitschia caucasica TaxID=637954 RepID=A0AAV2JH58_KNICA
MWADSVTFVLPKACPQLCLYISLGLSLCFSLRFRLYLSLCFSLCFSLCLSLCFSLCLSLFLSLCFSLSFSPSGHCLFRVELTGSSAFDYIHPGDHVEMADQLGMKLPPGRGLSLQSSVNEDANSSASSSSHADSPEPVESSSPSLLAPDNILEKSFFIRMKSTLTKRGVHIKSSGYKVIHVTGRLRIRMALTHSRSVPSQVLGMVVVAHALPPPTINEVRIDCQMFVSRVNMDLKIVYCENRISDYMDLAPVDVVGKRCYQFIHAEDVEGIRQCHLDLLNKGQCVTNYYRWIQKNGGYIWIQSSATIAINAKNNNDKNVIWVNYVLSNTEYKDTLMDLAQLPSLPEKTPETEESEESEAEYKEASDNEKSEGKAIHRSEHTEDLEAKRQVHCGAEPEPKQAEEEAAAAAEEEEEEENHSSNVDSQESDESENEEAQEEEAGENTERLTRISGLSALGGIAALGTLGGLHIKVERYGDGEEVQTRLRESSTSEEEREDEERDGKLRNRRKRRRSQPQWERGRRMRLSAESPSPVPLGENATLAESLANSPTSSTVAAVASSVLKIKTEMAEPINFDNDSSIWNYPPNREISRNELPYSMTSKPSDSPDEAFPSPQGQNIPDSVLTPPSNDGGGGATGGGASARRSFSSADPLSPPLSASPRDKTTPTTASTSPAHSASGPASSGPAPSVLYSGDLETLQRLQGNVVLPLVHRVSASLTPTSTSAQRVYTTGTIRYAPADMTLAMAQGNLLPNAAVNFVDGGGFGLDPKTPMEMLYHHVHRLSAAGGTFSSGTAGGGQVTTGDSLFSTLPFPLYTNGITQGTERKDD